MLEAAGADETDPGPRGTCSCSPATESGEEDQDAASSNSRTASFFPSANARASSAAGIRYEIIQLQLIDLLYKELLTFYHMDLIMDRFSLSLT